MDRETKPEPELSTSQIHWDEDFVAMNGNERANGTFVARAEDGCLLATVGYQNGHRHGLMRRYYRDGTLRREGFFRHGRPVGTYRKWHRNGQLREEWLMTDDGTVVRHRKWHEDGSLQYDSDLDHDARSNTES